jgi:hypothetical protein
MHLRPLKWATFKFACNAKGTLESWLVLPAPYRLFITSKDVAKGVILLLCLKKK